MRKIHRGLVAVVAAAACGLASQLPAQAAHDNTPPTLHTPLKAHFVTGSQLEQFDADDNDWFFYVPQVINWSGDDDSGDLYYKVWDYLAGDEPEELVNFTQDTSYQVTSSDYDSQFGGGSFATTNWSVQARDFSGNSTEHAVYGAYLVVTQDDGSQTGEHETDDVSVSYTGAWQTANCACFGAGTTHKSTAKNAAAVINVNVPAEETVRKVALVMETAPGRGKARIVVDGQNRGVVDTQANPAKHMVVVWQGSLATGAHTIRIVNLATAGRSRIDFDAVVVN